MRIWLLWLDWVGESELMGVYADNALAQEAANGLFGHQPAYAAHPIVRDQLRLEEHTLVGAPDPIDVAKAVEKALVDLSARLAAPQTRHAVEQGIGAALGILPARLAVYKAFGIDRHGRVRNDNTAPDVS